MILPSSLLLRPLSLLPPSLGAHDLHRRWDQKLLGSQARYVILRVLLEADAAAGGGLLAVESLTAADGAPDLLCNLGREALNTVGRAAIGEFLLKLQVRGMFFLD